MSIESKLLAMKRSAKPEPDDEPKTDIPPPKTGFLPTGLSREAVVVVQARPNKG